jgi:hypothetical protein
MKVIGIVGSRRKDTTEYLELVKTQFNLIFEKGDTIVSGGCPQGADRFAEIIAKEQNIPIKLYLAEWKKYGRSAGFQRNGLIAADADILIACVANDRTGGTEDTIKKYLKMHKKALILVS